MSGMSKKENEAFLGGVLCCLQIVAHFDQGTLFDEIVRATGETDLVQFARKRREMRLSGLSKYGYGRKGKNG